MFIRFVHAFMGFADQRELNSINEKNMRNGDSNQV